VDTSYCILIHFEHVAGSVLSDGTFEREASTIAASVHERMVSEEFPDMPAASRRIGNDSWHTLLTESAPEPLGM